MSGGHYTFAQPTERNAPRPRREPPAHCQAGLLTGLLCRGDADVHSRGAAPLWGRDAAGTLDFLTNSALNLH